MNNPISTYRLQFHKDFALSDFEKVIPYLQELGVKTVYASPIFEATPGSVHGYDGMNPHNINPEIGTEEQLFEISKKLKAAGIGWLQDIVPNHMAFDPKNPWLKDVLEKGQKSLYASFFDVPWTGKLYSGKIMLPFLGDTLQEVIDKGELSVAFDEQRFVLKYYDSAWPVRLKTYFTILDAAAAQPNQAVQQLLNQVADMRLEEDPTAYNELVHEFQMQLTGLMKNESSRMYIEQCMNVINADKEMLRSIADDQMYKLVNWQKTEQKINFRRFFTVNGLICLNMQNDEVFNHYHTYIKYLLDEGVFQGLRIDHVDGLFDPSGYLNQLRALVGPDAPIYVEKILLPGEELPQEWPIQGTTGYDFLAMVNNVFTNQKSKEAFTEYYHQLTNESRSVNQQIFESKSHILHEYMGGELDNLYHLFVSLSLVDTDSIESSQPGLLKEAIAQFLVGCPVYRYYGNRMPLNGVEQQQIEDILNDVSERHSELSPGVELLREALLTKPAIENDLYPENVLRFYQRMMQFTGPLMAKGVEDTLMYTYNRFIGHNEVGDAPEAFGGGIQTFHQQMQDRQAKWPLTINTTSTHDTKRGEDVRARLNVLTDLNKEWLEVVQEWRTLNSDLKPENIPDENDEYLIYQSLIGAAPMPGLSDEFDSRMSDYLQKAFREAKTHSNWTTPDEAYENTAKTFTAELLRPETPFNKSFQRFLNKIADFGIINSLSQLVLKFTCPGVPDVYQGTERWDLSLVDPDNRRLIEYSDSKTLFDKLSVENSYTDSVGTLWANRFDGGIKMWATHRLMQMRSRYADLFNDGEYLPLHTEGTYRNNVLAFARKNARQWMIVVVPLHLPEVCNFDHGNILDADWKDTSVTLPPQAPQSFQHLFSKAEHHHFDTILIRDIFTHFPLCILNQF